MSLLRGAAEDLPLEQWLRKRVWPLESALLSPEFVFDGSVLAAAEMLRSGITCFNDMYFFPDQTAQAAVALGMRASLGIVVIDFPTAYAASPQDYLRKGLTLYEQCRDEPLLSFTLAPHAPYTVSDENFSRVASLSAELDVPVVCHLHETADEIAASLRDHGARPLARLEKLGLLGPQLVAVHAVHLNAADIEMLAVHGASVAHCPHSNLKLASGLAPTASLLDRGVNVGIGTDGSASNNRLDLFSELRTAVQLAKAGSGNAAAWPVHQALESVTLAGARALGLADRIGSITPGKWADLVAIDLSATELIPVNDPAASIVHAVGREHVTDVWVGGRRVVQTRQFADSGAAALLAKVAARCPVWHNRINQIVGES
jgi:5-methylthioadenosine/S-adenosylhomocysteine deaminase